MLNIELIQLTIYSLALALLLVYLSQLPRFSLFLSSLLFILLILGINVLPLWRGSSLVELARGAIGDVSLMSGGLLILIIVNQFDFSDKRTAVLNRVEKCSLILVGFALYLSALGFISIDIYSWGYLTLWFPIAIALLAILLILFERKFGVVLLLALTGFYFKTQFSNNLWDYLFDPVLWIVLLVDFVSFIIPNKPENDSGIKAY